MVEPTSQWPKLPETAGQLMLLVAQGDVQKVRDFFDRAFWRNQTIRPGWEHLRTALLREDKPMMRLLATWGAGTEINSAEIAALDNPDRYLNLLRQCGIRITLSSLPRTERLLDINKVPQEWLHVLKAFQDTGAPEAVIAGGALRDIFNSRAVKDVDIFMKTRGSSRKNRKFIEKSFQASNLELVAQATGVSYSDAEEIFILKEKDALMESWDVVAGPNKTKYNIIFTAAETGGPHPAQFGYSLLAAFDFGLCMISCTGTTIIAPSPYWEDVKNKEITLQKYRQGSKEHLERIIKKYPRWEPCPESKKLLTARGMT